jgi:hypothetical protein
VFRLRIPLRLKTKETQLREAFYDMELPDDLVVPARTTLRLIDFVCGTGPDDVLAVALTPDGKKVGVSAATCREHAYIPRLRKPDTA